MPRKKDKKQEMQQIHDEVMDLTDSPLYTYRTENEYLPVTGEGSLDTDFVFIGEAPGKNEAKTGRPFCGAAGKTLDHLLSSIDLSREDIYITNIVKARPPENRDPTEEEIACYGPLLDRQINIIQPKVIVTLGRYSMAYSMKKFDLADQLEPIGAAHGTAYDALATYGPVKINPQYHPAAAIYNRSLIGTLEQDFKIIPTLV